jgi:DNA-binding response OmpR family regulator
MAGEKILDIDDSPTVQRLIEMILSSQGYQVVLASDGEEGIAKARSEHPAVILVDFVMPKMNGFQFCKTLKEDPNFRNTPIILVTSKGDKVGSKFVDVFGITEYFTKPFQPEELLAKIREVLDKQKTAPLAIPVREEFQEPHLEASVESHTFPLQRKEPSTAPVGIESMVRSIVKEVLHEFIKKTLPDLIKNELGNVQASKDVGIQGRLASVQIAEVLQMLGLQRQTGRLVVRRANDAVEIYFKDGAVVLAASGCTGPKSAMEDLLKRCCGLEEEDIDRILSATDLTAHPIDQVLVRENIISGKTFSECHRRYTESAVFKTMAWDDGEFFFEKALPPVFADTLPLKVDDLLLEGARRADEWSLIQQKIPRFDIVFEPMIGDADELATRGMSDFDLSVFSCVDGRRTVQNIIDILHIGEFDVFKSLFILLSVNLIRRRR